MVSCKFFFLYAIISIIMNDNNEEKKYTLSEEAKFLLKVYSKEEKPDDLLDGEKEKIKISKTISHLSFWYEKLRNAVDYQEEHLLRKNTIRRIISRKYNIPIPTMEKDSISLIKELIRANYLEIEEISSQDINKIDQALERYSLLRREIFLKKTNKNLSRYLKILLDTTACEIEEILVSHQQEEALANCMLSIVKKRLDLTDKMKEKLDDIHIYIAISKVLSKSDLATIRFKILQEKYPNWLELKDEEKIISSYEDFFKINLQIDELINHPLVDLVQKIIRKKTAPYNILNKVLKYNKNNSQQIFSNSQTLANLVENLSQESYTKAGSRLRRSVIQSIIYILLTKMLLGILLELPYDLIFFGSINYLPLAINLIFPPAFMFLITANTKVPDWRNTEKIMAEIKTIVYEEEQNQDQKKYHFESDRARTKTKKLFLTLLYLLTFVLSFGVIIYLLNYLNFNLVSGILFFFFLSIVSFFAFRIKQNAKNLLIVDEAESASSIFTEFMFMPFLRIGRWISIKFAGINVFLILLDFVIEAPFKTLIDISEEWINYMKEKKEELT